MARSCVACVLTFAVLAAFGGPALGGEAKAASETKAPDKKGAEKGKQPPTPPQPIHVWADRIRYSQGDNLARMTGNATVIKGDMRIDADTILADLDEKTNEFKKMTATGNVRVNTVLPVAQRTTARPPLQPGPDPRSAECDKAVYDSASGIVTLHGTPQAQPIVHFGKDEARADLIIYDRNKNVITFEGNALVTALLPVKGDEKAPPAKAEPPKSEPPKEAPPAK